MSERGDCRKLKRQRYHEWMRRRWMGRAEAAKARRETRQGRKEGARS
jgi:hypothetical protein